MRIAYVTETYPPEINGVSLTAARSVQHLRAAGHAVQLIRPHQRGETRRRDADTWHSFGGPIPLYPELRYGLARAATLRRAWRLAPPDLVHVATPGPLAWAALAAARAEGLATSADFRTNFHAYSRHYGLGWAAPAVFALLRRLHAKADLTFVPTPALARELHAAGFRRLQVVGRGVDAERFSPAWRDDTLRAQWGASPATRVMLHVGRLAPEKNVQLALAVFERARAAGEDVAMVVVGSGPQRPALEAAHPQVHFVGPKLGQALARHYASADLFLFPSLTDTFGNVTLEALASGLAVVAFETAAAAQHVHDGVDGCLAPTLGDTAAAFHDAARRALAQAAPGGPLRAAARAAGRRADWDAVLRRFEQALVGLVDARAPVPQHAAVA